MLRKIATLILLTLALSTLSLPITAQECSPLVYPGGWGYLAPDGSGRVLNMLAEKENESKVYVWNSGANFNLSEKESYLSFGSTEVQAFNPAWSHDGNSLAFVQYNFETEAVNIVVASADGSRSRQITDSAIWSGHISWSPEGTIAYDEESDSGTDIWVMDPESGNAAVNLTNTPNIKEDDHAWSPDGQQLVYISGFSKISVIDKDGGNARELIDAGSTIWSIEWLKSGIVYVVSKDPMAGFNPILMEVSLSGEKSTIQTDGGMFSGLIHNVGGRLGYTVDINSDRAIVLSCIE